MTTPRTAGRLLCTTLVGASAMVLGLAVSTAAFAAGPAGRSAYRAPSPSASASPTATSKTNVRSLTVSGPGLRRPLTFRQDRQAAQYNVMLAEVAWMDERTGDFIDSTPADLGPDYTVTLLTNGKATATYDLFPEVLGGPRAHRQATGSADEAWFFAPIDMANKLASVGVRIPEGETTASAGFTQPTIATTAPVAHLSDLVRESRTALILAGVAAAGILVLLGFAARRSRARDHRGTMAPAIARLQSVRAKASSGPGAMLRSAAPPPGTRRPMPGPVRAEPPESGRPGRPVGVARVANATGSGAGPIAGSGAGPIAGSGAGPIAGSGAGPIAGSGAAPAAGPGAAAAGPEPAGAAPTATRATGRARIPAPRSGEVDEPMIGGTHVPATPDLTVPDTGAPDPEPAAAVPQTPTEPID